MNQSPITPCRYSSPTTTSHRPNDTSTMKDYKKYYIGVTILCFCRAPVYETTLRACVRACVHACVRTTCMCMFVRVVCVIFLKLLTNVKKTQTNTFISIIIVIIILFIISGSGSSSSIMAAYHYP